MILERKILFAIEQLKKESKINNKPIWDLKDVMFITSYSESKLYKLTSSGEIPFFKKGKKLYFEPAKVLAWLKEDNIDSDAEEFKKFQNKKNSFL